MRYKLALELKKAGYPQEELDGYFSCGCSELREELGEGNYTEVYKCNRDYAYYPTLLELFKACKEEYFTLHSFPDGSRYSVENDKKGGFELEYGEEDEDGHREWIWGLEADELMARLWLILNKK